MLKWKIDLFKNIIIEVILLNPFLKKSWNRLIQNLFEKYRILHYDEIIGLSVVLFI